MGNFEWILGGYLRVVERELKTLSLIWFQPSSYWSKNREGRRKGKEVHGALVVCTFGFKEIRARWVISLVFFELQILDMSLESLYWLYKEAKKEERVSPKFRKLWSEIRTSVSAIFGFGFLLIPCIKLMMNGLYVFIVLRTIGKGRRNHKEPAIERGTSL